MLILILDDMKVRHDSFDRTYADHEIIHAYSYSDCIKALNGDRKFDLVHLDHDLDEFSDRPEYYQDGWGRKRFYNGMHVVSHISEMDITKYPDEVIVHSINSSAAPDMVRGLKRIGIFAVWIPFGNLEIDIDRDGNDRYDF